MKLLLLAFLIVLSVSTQAQIKVIEAPNETIVGKAKASIVTLATLSYYITSGSDTMYRILYKNIRYSNIEDYKTFSFASTNGEINDVYNVFKSFFQPDAKKELMIEVDKQTLFISKEKSFGTPYIMITVDKNSFFNLTEKQLDKLFAK